MLAKSPATVGAFRSLRARLLFWILAVAMPIYAGATYLSYQSTARLLEADAIHEADQLASRLAQTVDTIVRPIEAGIRTVAYQLEEVAPPRSQYLQRIRGILAAWPDVYGSTIAVEEDTAGGKAGGFAPYLFRGKGGEISYADLALDSYDYRHLPWYQVAAERRQPVWSAPYFDAGGGETWMITYSVPFFRKQPQGGQALAGIITADLDLAWIRKHAASTSMGSMGMGWLYPEQKEVEFIAAVGDSAARLARFDPQLDLAALRSTGEEMLAGNTRFHALPRAISAKRSYLVVRNLQTTGWHLALVIPHDQLLAEAQQLLNRQILLGIVGIALLIIAVSVVASGITRPIRELAAAVGDAGAGQLDFRLPDRTRRDELGTLTGALRHLRDSLQQHVELRVRSLAQEARMDQELQVSAQIQQSMLPSGRSLQSLPAAVAIATILRPARQVGGDLYDFFPLHDGQVMFVIGDVSDKGVPAALFMARFSALMRVLGAASHGPARLLAEINDRLVENNDACMFVTVGCGLLDPATGRFRYASAGHEAPLLRRMEGNVETLRIDNGAAIGIDSSAEYTEHEGFLAPGDTLFLFTDGVTEAEAADGTLFGSDRVIALLAAAPDGAPATLISQVTDQASSHAAGFHATDDLTAMAVRCMPADASPRHDDHGAGWRMEVAVSSAGVAQAQLRLHGILLSRQVAPEQCHDVELVAEEWMTNVVRANRAAAAQLSMDLLLAEDSITLGFRDNGVAFNPLEAADPQLDAHIADRAIGGLGIHLLKQLADSCQYSRVDNCNVLSVSFRRAR